MDLLKHSFLLFDFSQPGKIGDIRNGLSKYIGLLSVDFFRYFILLGLREFLVVIFITPAFPNNPYYVVCANDLRTSTSIMSSN